MNKQKMRKANSIISFLHWGIVAFVIGLASGGIFYQIIWGAAMLAMWYAMDITINIYKECDDIGE